MKYIWQDTDPSARLLNEAEALPAAEVSSDRAQIQVNFVVFDSQAVPVGCRVRSITMRPEQPPGRPGKATAESLSQTPWSQANPSSVRVVIEGLGRRLRVKQFLYDWAPPAASIAPLAGRDARPYRSGDYICWIGTDYKGRLGACVQKKRTQIEVSVEMGVFSDAELVSLIDGLRPANESIAAEVDSTPFHELSYWYRYGMKSTGVPHGLWKYRATHSYEEAKRGSLNDLARATQLPAKKPAGDHYRLDSAASMCIGASHAPHLEYIFRSSRNYSDHLWFMVAAQQSEAAIPISPEREDYPAAIRQQCRVGQREAWYAALTLEHGGWEAMWQERDAGIAVWASSSLDLNYEKFKDLIGSLVDIL